MSLTPEEKRIIQVLKKNPKSHIHYWDNQEWSIYESKKEVEKEMEQDGYEAKILLSGSDFGSDYCPALVTALLHMQGKTSSSI